MNSGVGIQQRRHVEPLSTNPSLGSMFIAGVVPGIALATMLGFTTWWRKRPVICNAGLYLRARTALQVQPPVPKDPRSEPGSLPKQGTLMLAAFFLVAAYLGFADVSSRLMDPPPKPKSALTTPPAITIASQKDAADAPSRPADR